MTPRLLRRLFLLSGTLLAQKIALRRLSEVSYVIHPIATDKQLLRVEAEMMTIPVVAFGSVQRQLERPGDVGDCLLWKRGRRLFQKRLR